MFRAFTFSFILGLALILQGFQATGQAPARLRCVEVLDNGDTELHWIPEVFGTGAYSYTLYHSSNLAGPYTLLDSITNLPQDNLIHTGAGANLAPQYYFMRIYRLSGVSAPSDTLATIFLQGSTIDFETINLTWTPLHVPMPSYAYPWYLLYREYPPGNWSIVDSTQGLSIDYHFWDCNQNDDTVNFKIGVMVDEAPLIQCMSFSNEVGSVLKNQTNRFPPVIDSVSINSDGHSVIGWEPAPEPDILGYTIYLVTTFNDSIGFASGRLNTSFVHLSSVPCDGPLTYIISSIDSCGNESPFPYNPATFEDKPQNTLYLQDIEYDPCSMSNTLTWNAYQNFEPPLQGYKVYASENYGPYNLLITLPISSTTYTQSGLNSNTHYSYYVRAFILDNSKTSTSCTKEVDTYDSPIPAFNYIRYVSVENNVQVNVLFYADSSAHVKTYKILRSENATGPFDQVGYLQDPGQDSIFFTDANADPTVSSYYYEVEVTDSCGVRTTCENISRTIFLTVDALENYQNVLNWNAYESWDGGVAGYRVYRRLDNNPSLDLLADVIPSQLTYTDDVSGLTTGTGIISYLIEAYQGTGNGYSFQEVSYSNEAYAEQQARIYMPNAIVPSGINNILKPVMVFVGEEGYQFYIYNRWGQLIFNTGNPDDGWDGTFKGKLVEQGVYVYLIYYMNSANQVQVKKGNVAVIY